MLKFEGLEFEYVNFCIYKLLGPGPTYSLPPTIGYEKHDQRKTRSPQYTMAGRLKVKDGSITPGPYIATQGLTRYGRPRTLAYSLAPRTFVKGK